MADADPDTVVLDLDGTLVDSVPVHVVAWRCAFRDVGLAVPSHHIHRAIGMGGDRLVAAVTSDAVEASQGDHVRELHADYLDRLFGAIGPTDGAAELLTALRERGMTTVLASSSEKALTERLVELVEGADTLPAVSGEDADESKPDGQLVELAMRKVDATGAVMLGDAVWDVRSASDAGIACIGLLTGGISEAELREGGAVAVFDSPRAIVEHLEQGGSLLPSAGAPASGS